MISPRTSDLVIAALAAGALAAAVAAWRVAPAVAFVIAFAAVAAAGLVLRRRAERARRAAPPPEAPRAKPVQPPQIGFGPALMETLPAPVLIIARTGRVTFANSAAHAAFSRIEPGAHFASLIRAPAFVEAIGRTLAEGRPQDFEFTTHQGRERIFEARTALLPSNGAFGEEAQAIVLIEDRTQARRAEQLRSDFIANASHELRTPLASIIGYIETLQNHARNDPEAREQFLEIMAREAGRMRRLVDDLMSLSRIEMSEHVRPVEEWPLNRIAADSASALAPVAADRGVKLTVDLDPDAAMVRCDRDQMAQVFANLIDNAIKYGGAGVEVRVAAAAPDAAHPNRCGVSVSDTGPGIPRDHIHRLTERFYRVNVSSSRNRGGTGLGLAIVKHVLNRHEGRLEIVSEPGEGSRFTVWLPRAGRAAGPVHAVGDPSEAA